MKRLRCMHCIIDMWCSLQIDLLSMATVALKGDLQDVFTGVLHKCGGKVKSWNKRFFVLKSDYCLYYYKDASKGALGSISLRDPKFEARKGTASDMSWPRQTKLDCTMAIVTSYRTYCMYSLYSHEIEEWIKMLTKAKELVHTNSENKLLSGARSASSSQIEQSRQDPDVPTADEKARPLSEMQPPENYEVMYDAPVVPKPNEGEPQPEPTYALAHPEEPEEQLLYEDILPTKQEPISPEETTPSANEVYEDISPQMEPAASKQAAAQSGEQPLYDDISADIAQPLYEDIPPQIGVAIEEEQSQAQDSLTPPPLPPIADIPPLPPREGATSPPLPPKEHDETPPSPPPRMTPPLPSKAEYDETPPSPLPRTSQSDDDIPTYDTPPVLHKEGVTPPSPIPPSPPPRMAHTYDSPPVHLVTTDDIYDAPPNPEPMPDAPHTHETTPTRIEATPPNDKKPSPVPRRRSFSPPHNQPPVAKPRIRHGKYIPHNQHIP